MQVTQPTTNPGIIAGNAGNASNAVAVDGTALGLAGENAATPIPVTPTPTSAAPLQQGLSNWDQPLQGDISGAQQALDFLEQSAAQLRNLKAELSAKLAASQTNSGTSSGSSGTVEARVRQFSNTWKQRQQASGGTVDSTLNFSRSAARQSFTVRGMTMANLRSGGREVLAISVGGSAQGLRSVSLGPGMSNDDIVNAFNTALAPSNITVSVDDQGNLQFSTPEANWPSVRDTIAVQGSGIRFPTGQLNRVKADPVTPAVDPDSWQTSDTDSLRATLQQVVQALAQVEQALGQVEDALSQASARVDSSQPVDSASGMGQAAQNFVSTTSTSGYQSLLSLTSALSGISRDRVMSLLALR